MNNKSSIINIVLGVAVVVLYILHFSSSGGGSTQEISDEEALAKADSLAKAQEADSLAKLQSDSIDLSITAQALSFPIAYVNIDKINTEYQFMIEKQAWLQRQLKSLQRNYEQSGKEIQGEIAKVQEQFQAGLLTEVEAQKLMVNLQEKAMKKEKDIAQRQEYLQKEEQKVIKEVSDDITAFLESQKEDLRYSYVLMRGGITSNVLYANDSLDITDKLLNALNENYAAKKGN